MNAPLFCLTLASLLLVPALGVEEVPMDHWLFMSYHTSSYWLTFRCRLNMPWQKDETACIPSHYVILGDTSDTAARDDILSICREQGTSIGGNLFRSNNNFRVAKCSLEDRNAAAPNCEYKPTYHIGQVVVGCSRGYPVHFEGLE